MDDFFRSVFEKYIMNLDINYLVALLLVFGGLTNFKTNWQTDAAIPINKLFGAQTEVTPDTIKTWRILGSLMIAIGLAIGIGNFVINTVLHKKIEVWWMISFVMLVGMFVYGALSIWPTTTATMIRVRNLSKAVKSDITPQALIIQRIVGVLLAIGAIITFIRFYNALTLLSK